MTTSIGVCVVDQWYEISSIQGKAVFYHRCSTDSPGTFNPEMIVSGRHGARHAFELRGTGAMGSGLYCTLEEPSGCSYYRATVNIYEVYYVDGIKNVLLLDEWNRACIKRMWNAVCPETSDWFEGAWPFQVLYSKMALLFKICEARGASILHQMTIAYSSDAKLKTGAHSSEVHRTAGVNVDELTPAMRDGSCSGAAASGCMQGGTGNILVVQPITFVLMALGYKALVYSGDAIHLNNDMAYGCIVFPEEAIPPGLDAERAEIRTGVDLTS